MGAGVGMKMHVVTGQQVYWTGRGSVWLPQSPGFILGIPYDQAALYINFAADNGICSLQSILFQLSLFNTHTRTYTRGNALGKDITRSKETIFS